MVLASPTPTTPVPSCAPSPCSCPHPPLPAEVVARRDDTGPLIPALGGRVGQGALATGYGQASGQGARVSVGGLSTVTPSGTGTESVTAASVRGGRGWAGVGVGWRL